MANKFLILAIALAFIVAVSAIGGVKDWAGNYYDLTTGQYSSSLTGRVYNTYGAPAVVAAAPYAYAAPYAAPLHYSSAYAYAPHYPLAYNRLLLK
ncbi:unnamed protein product [Medioppia subpectinata]|uniref:Uncharacterized protein n=1 Tax=Medioppia subpectinata TaxID=1979941 RepID=A0A7R9Q0C1_9ACAR|nr:unnamed protein product [Medioppia subpectinata]CAG2107916.1 unnamed protein product [Medioppia subpectinata]